LRTAAARPAQRPHAVDQVDAVERPPCIASQASNDGAIRRDAVERGLASAFADDEHWCTPSHGVGPGTITRLRILKKREHIRKIIELRADLEKDDRNEFDMLEEKLGDFGLTELGKAALAKVAKTAKASPEIPDKAPAIDSLKKPGNGAPAQA